MTDTIGPIQDYPLFSAIIGGVDIDVVPGSNMIQWWYVDEKLQTIGQWSFTIAGKSDEDIVREATATFQPKYVGVRNCVYRGVAISCLALDLNKTDPIADYNRAMQVIGKR